MGKRRETIYSPKSYKSDHPIPTATPTPVAAVTPLANLSLSSVLLHDWWLGMAQPRGLAVGGFECRRRQGQRVLCSAAIAKRHDATTLVTVDGITVSISGFINASRTLQNSFPSEVCSHFLFGFPYDWEEYASQCSKEESVSRRTQASITDLLGVNRSSRSNVISFPPASLDNLPATRVKVIQNHMDDNSISYSRSKRTVESQNEGQSRMRVSILTPTTGVITRSMTRFKYLTEKQEGLSSKSSAKRIKRVQLSSPEAKENHYGENQEHKQAKNLSAQLFIIPKSNPQLSTSEPCTMCPRKIGTRSALRGNRATTLSKAER